MTSPKGGGNDINLAALWVPVMPETSQLVPAMRKAGQEGQKAFAQAFQGQGGGEEAGKQWANQFMKSFNSTFAGIPVPQGIRDFMGSFQNETRATERELRKLGETQQRTFSEHEKLAAKAAQMQAEITRRTLEYNRAFERGKASVTERHAIIALQRQHNEVIGQANVKANEYSTATRALTDVTGAASNASNLLAGAIGGGIGAAVTLGVAGIGKLAGAFVHLVGEGINLAISGVEKFSSLVLETGQNYEMLSNQLDLYTNATGDNLKSLNTVAADVFGNMDSSASEVGKTIGILSQRLGLEAGPALTTLTTHVEELRDRFGQLDVEQFTAGLISFRVPAEQADAALASLVQSARGAGTPVNEVITALRSAAPTLTEAGMSYEQAAAFVAELTKRGLEARSMMTGLQTAQKEFGELGLTFSEGMRLAAERMKALKAAGDEAGAQDLAQKLFGTRRWAEALTMMDTFSDIISRQPGEFAASADSLDHLIENTQTLGDKWEEVKRKGMEALRPMGEAAVGVLGTGLEKLKTYIDQNMSKIMERVRALGNSFIEQLPFIQHFTAEAIRFGGQMVDFFTESLGILIQTMSQFAGQFSLLLDALPDPVEKMIPGYTDFKESLNGVAAAGVDLGGKLRKLEVSEGANEIADWIENQNINVPELKRNWNDLVDDINNNQPRSIGTGVGFTMPGLGGGGVGGPGTLPGLPGGGAPGGAGSSAGTSVPAGGLAGLPSGGGRGATLGIVASQQNNPQANKALAQQLFPWPPSEWSAFDALEMKEAGYDSTARNPSSGAFGMGQFLGHENDQYASGYSHDPATQLQTMFRYIADRYGTPSAALSHHLKNNWYQRGGTVPTVYSDPENPLKRPSFGPEPPWSPIWPQPASKVPGSLRDPRCDYPDHPVFEKDWASVCHACNGMTIPPNSRDTVPLWAEPGEEIINAKSSARFRPLLKWMNAQGLQGGGTATDTSTTLASKAPGGYDPSVTDLVGWMKNLVAQYNSQTGANLQITADRSGYAGQMPGDTGHPNEGGSSQHDVNRAVDISGSTAEMNAFAQWWQSNPEYVAATRQLIYGGTIDKNIFGGAFTSGNTTYAESIGGHYNHIHLGLEGAPASLTGAAPGMGNNTMALNFPGSPYGTPGFTGGYGPEDWEAKSRNEQAVREARQRASDMDYTISEKQKQIADLQAERDAAAKGETDILGRPVPADPKKLKEYDDKIADAKHDLSISERERADQNGEIADAERKLAEGTKAKAQKKDQRRQATGMELFSDLGGAFLGGIAEELGMGDVFGKPPWEWGITKLLTGGLNWGIGTANAWAEEIGKGHTGMTGFQPMAGFENGGSGGGSFLSGMFPSLSGLMPQAAGTVGNQGNFGATTAPNVAPSTGMPNPMGAYGPPPGPTIGGDYQPITVNNNGPKQSDYDAWKGAQNTRTEPILHGGGLPKP